jgi:hypothetical protein
MEREMVLRFFPQALVACIGEGRPPLQHELAMIADKVWREAFGQGVGQGMQDRAMNVAYAALIGDGLAA